MKKIYAKTSGDLGQIIIYHASRKKATEGSSKASVVIKKVYILVKHSIWGYVLMDH